MDSTQSRRRMLATLSSAAAAGLIGCRNVFAQEAAPEVTTIRLPKIPGICIAPQYVAEELLKIEGFNDVQYIEVPLDQLHAWVGTEKIDISMGYASSFIVEVERDTPIVMLGGVHAG